MLIVSSHKPSCSTHVRQESQRLSRHLPFLFSGVRLDSINANQYVVRTLNDYFPWPEPNTSCSKEDWVLECERMRFLLHLIREIAPITLFLVGNEELVTSGRTTYFFENLPFHHLKYHALIEHEAVDCRIRKDLRTVLSLHPQHLEEFQLKTLQLVVNDKRFTQCLSESRKTMDKRNKQLTFVSRTLQDSATEDASSSDHSVMTALLLPT